MLFQEFFESLLACTWVAGGMSSGFYKRKFVKRMLEARDHKRKKKEKKRSLVSGQKRQQGFDSGQWMEVIKQVSRKELLCMQLRRVQRKTGCSTTTLDLAMGVMQSYIPFKLPKSVREADKYMREMSGAQVLLLHGCTNRRCSGHVFSPDDCALECPLCGDLRYDENGKPKEAVHYFPLKAKLQQLLKLPKFREALLFEKTRQVNEKYIADVFDSPRWKQLTEKAQYIGISHFVFFFIP